MLLPRPALRRGFTLIELLIVIGILGILAAIVLVAINPGRQLGAASDAERLYTARQLEKAQFQYLIDRGVYAADKAIPNREETASPICRSGQAPAGCINVDALVPDYLPCIPHDGAEPNVAYIGYRIYQDAGRVHVSPVYLGSGSYFGGCDGLLLNRDGLVGYWPFDDGAGTTVADASGSGNDGTLVGFGNDGDVFRSDDTPSQISFLNTRSLHFSGCYAPGQCPNISDPGNLLPHVDLGTDSSLNPTTGLTLAAWIKPDGNTGYRYIFGEGRDVGGYGFDLILEGNNTLYGQVHTPEGNKVVDPSAPVAAGTWQHVAMTFDGTVLKIYQDGVLTGTTTLGDPTTIRYDGDSVKIGLMGQIFYGYYHFAFVGSIDDARMYARALTAAEIADIAAGRR